MAVEGRSAQADPDERRMRILAGLAVLFYAGWAVAAVTRLPLVSARGPGSVAWWSLCMVILGVCCVRFVDRARGILFARREGDEWISCAAIGMYVFFMPDWPGGITQVVGQASAVTFCLLMIVGFRIERRRGLMRNDRGVWVYTSQLSPEVCAQTLSTLTRSDDGLSMSGGDRFEILRRSHHDGMILRVRDRGKAERFLRRFVVRFLPTTDGTDVIVKPTEHPAGGIITSAAAVALAIALAIALSMRDPLALPLAMTFPSVLWLVAMGIWIRFTHRRGQMDSDRIEELFKRELRAAVVSKGIPS